MAEVDKAIARETLPREGDFVTENQAKQLPLLQATIRESLRWYPVVAAELSKSAPLQGDTICGYFVPDGTKVGCSMKAVHRNVTLFGPDASAFRPHRWLLSPQLSTTPDMLKALESWGRSESFVHPSGHENDPERLQAMLRNNDMVFGSRRFQCLGKPVALLELNKVFIELLRRYEFELNDVLNPWHARCCGTHLQKDMWANVRRRGAQ